MKWTIATTLLLGVTNALSLHGSISDDVLPLSRQDLTETTLKLSTSSEKFTTFLKQDGSFVFNNLTQGEAYALEIESVPIVADAVYRVDVVNEHDVQIHKVLKGQKFDDIGPKVDTPFKITVVRPTYVIPREEFSVISMLKNPMMLMSLASLVMVFVLPKLTENLDPDTLQEIQENQKQSNAAMDKVQNFDMAGYLAGKSDKKRK